MARLAPIDWMRGLVMVLMAIDHASVVFNGGRIAGDSAALYDGSALPLAQFLTRWITHLCAPTFVFLAGTALALSTESRLARGESASEIDRHLLIRGTFIVLLDVVWMTTLASRTLLLQVLYAIGFGIVAMVPLRRLRPTVLFGAGISWFMVGELVTRAVWDVSDLAPNFVVAGLVGIYRYQGIAIMYAALPWLAMMMMGWGFGVYLRSRETAPIHELVLAGLASLTLFVLVRGFNGYGNMGLFRLDGSFAQWLHVSKYPPSLAYASLELGLMALCLAAFFVGARYVSVRERGPLLVFGQTALFFYLLHFPLLAIGGLAIFGKMGRASLAATYIAASAVLLVLYPVCLRYRRLKRAHPKSVLQYV